MKLFQYILSFISQTCSKAMQAALCNRKVAEKYNKKYQPTTAKTNNKCTAAIKIAAMVAVLAMANN